MGQEWELFAAHEKKRWGPFEVRETQYGKTLRLYGQVGAPADIHSDKVAIILKAIAMGWNIDIRYAAIHGELDIEQIQVDKSGNVRIDPDIHLKMLPPRRKMIYVKGNIKINHSKIINPNGFFNFSGGKPGGMQASFIGDVDFSNTIFPRSAYFSGARFCRSAIFYDVSFRYADFSGTKFKDVRFCRADFNYGNFQRATFGDVNFLDAHFNDSADFSDSEFIVRANFRETSMDYPARFLGVQFRRNTVVRGLWNEVIHPYIFMPWTYLCPVCRVLHRLWARMRRSKYTLTDLSRRGDYLCELWQKMQQKLIITDFGDFNTTTVMDGASNSYLNGNFDYSRKPLLYLAL